MIEGSCDDHRTKISSDAQVSFARGVWMHLGWEETEPPLNEMALDQTWSLPEGTSRRSHEYETRPWTFLPVKPPSSLWGDSETTMMCGPMNLGIGLPDSKRHEPRHLFPAWSAAGSQFWTRLYRPGRPSGYDPSSTSNLLVACWTPSPLWLRLHGCAFMAAPFPCLVTAGSQSWTQLCRDLEDRLVTTPVLGLTFWSHPKHLLHG